MLCQGGLRQRGFRAPQAPDSEAFRGEIFAAMGSPRQPLPSAQSWASGKEDNTTACLSLPRECQAWSPRQGTVQLQKGTMYPGMAFPVVRQRLACTTQQ